MVCLLSDRQSQSQGQHGAPLVTKAVRAHAVATLGKLCLQDEDGAKRCVPALVRELQTNPDHIIRNNIIVVLSDLCIRFVDCFL
jgi:condensin-2 complex subunit D3